MGDVKDADDDPSKIADQTKVVALYDFEPSKIDWPFNRQKPLALSTGQVVEIVHDDGSEWALGHLAGVPETLGYFPKNYTVSVGEYQEMMRDFENQEQQDGDEDEAEQVQGPPETRAIPAGPLPAPLVEQQTQVYYDEQKEKEKEASKFSKKKDEPQQLPELVYPGISEFPAIEARPPQPTAFEVTKSRMLREMPPVSSQAPVSQEIKQQPYKTDLRARSTTLRVAAGIEPAHMRFALQRANETGAKWKQMFRRLQHMQLLRTPGYNDTVNEAFKVGCNSCILSQLYLKDVMMAHPDAWGFPDTSRVVAANPGEPVNPFHGWYAQHSIDPEAELEDVELLGDVQTDDFRMVSGEVFRYTLRLRSFPETTFQALALGKIPEWIKPYLSLHAEAEAPDDLTVEEDEEAMPTETGKAIELENNLMMEAGLKGLSAMRIFLRSRGNPDSRKEDMAAQLGIQKRPAHYWYCMFALRYPLAPDWEAVVREDTRWFLWDFRGFVKMKCSECPDNADADMKDLDRCRHEIDAAWRGFAGRRVVCRQQVASVSIQKVIRGFLHGRRLIRQRHKAAARIQALVRGIFVRQRFAKRLLAAIRIQAPWPRGARIRGLWDRRKAQLHVKKMVYERIEMLRLKRLDVLRAKLQEAAIVVLQRNWRRHVDAQNAIDERKEKGDADKRTTTMLVAAWILRF
eukprot:Skav223744  [mRNA]  locus=scaffold3575:101736:126192:- [translate_table: standard]